jgi:hypothetical protein
VHFYPAALPLASSAADDGGRPPEGAGGEMMVAVRLSDLVSPVRRRLRWGDRTALTCAGAGKIRSGDVVVFCRPVVVAAAVVRRDGHVQAGGHPADHARLGVLETRLEEMTRPGIIDEVAASVPLGGKVKGTARRTMTAALTLRAVLLMTLMPEAGYAPVMTALLGDLAAVPWHKPFAVPSETVLSTWREAAGPEPARQLEQMVLAASASEHDDYDYRALHVGDLQAGSVDGSVTRMPDTPANRAACGSTGTGDDSAPYPQLRDLWISGASTRGTLGVLTGPSGGDKAEAGQALPDTALDGLPGLFTPGPAVDPRR